MILILFLIILNFCTNDNKPLEVVKLHNRSYPLELEKEKEVILDVLPMNSIPHFTRMDDASLHMKYINRDRKFVIMRYDSSLKLEKTFFVSYGEGPCEAIYPIIFNNEKDILMLDIFGKRLLLWDYNFENCTMEKKDLAPRLGGNNGIWYSPRHDLLLLWEKIKKGAKIKYRVYLKKLCAKTPNQRLLYEIEYIYRTQGGNGLKKVLISQPIHCILFQDNVYLLDVRDYILYKYGLDGELQKSVKIEFTPRSFTTSKLREWQKNSGTKTTKLRYPQQLWPACWILAIGKGLAVGRREDYQFRETGWITADYFDLNLKYQGKIKLPAFKWWNDPELCENQLELRTFYKDGFLYLIETRETETDEDFVLGKWRVKNVQRQTEALRP